MAAEIKKVVRQLHVGLGQCATEFSKDNGLDIMVGRRRRGADGRRTNSAIRLVLQPRCVAGRVPDIDVQHPAIQIDDLASLVEDLVHHERQDHVLYGLNNQHLERWLSLRIPRRRLLREQLLGGVGLGV